MLTPDAVMEGYLLKTYANRAPSDYIPSLIGTPIHGSSATAAYYERVAIPDRHVIAMTKTQYVVEGTDDPILQVRHPAGKVYNIPKSELEEIAAAHQDDEIFDMLKHLFRGRVH